MTIDEEIETLKKEIDNIYALYKEDILEAYNSGKISNDEEKVKGSLDDIAKKYAVMLFEREEKLNELLEKKDRGI